MISGFDQTALWNLMNGIEKDPIQVGWLHPGYRRAIGAATPFVMLSSYTVDHIMLGHRAQYYELFKLTPEIIRAGHCFRIDRRSLVFVYASLSEPKKPYRAVVKATKSGEVFLESTYRIKFSQARNSMRRMSIIPRD